MRTLGCCLVGLVACGGSSLAVAPAPPSHAPCGVSVGETSVSLEVDGGTLYGTQMAPATCPASGAALIIAGSGPTDRDGNGPSLATNAYKELAAHLAQRGFLSVRYDKRGVAQSAAAGPAEQDLRFETYVDDARAWAQSIAGAGIRPLVVFGHSEGSLVGILAAQTGIVDALVSLDGAGRPAGEVVREQLATKVPPADLSAVSSAIDQLEAGQPVTTLPASVALLFRASVQPYLISWFRYDPAAEIGKLAVPVLIVQGTADRQTTPVDADDLYRSARRGTRATIPQMAHPLKLADPADSLQVRAYTDPSLPLAPALLDAIDAFLATLTTP